MELFFRLLVGLIAIEHLYILWIEMFAWGTIGKKIFKGAMPAELFTPTKTLAANQGLYNGFLAAGLIWTFFISDEIWQTNISMFFLACVAVAGCYGAVTASKKIFYVQALPAIVALFVVVLMQLNLQ